MNEKERYAAVRACKWVDEIVEDAPYVTELASLDEYNIDFCVHGEDITTDENGRDCYSDVKEAGRFQLIKRTDGVSTTDLVGRMLLMTKNHLPASVRSNTHPKVDPTDTSHIAVASESSPYTGVSTFLASTRRISQFAAGNRAPRQDDVIVYVDGSFDLFNFAHIEALRIAKSYGTFLIVGVHDDAIVNQTKGGNLPILNLQERVLSVLQCGYVDEVITGAPWEITKSMVDTLHISYVVSGSVCDYPNTMNAPYAIPKELGIFKQFDSPHPNTTTSSIIDRILTHRQRFIERNREKQKSEIEYLKQKKDGKVEQPGVAFA